MSSTFFPIETMRRAIMTQKQVMDVIGHNVANASTPGYSRQVAVLHTTDPFSYPGTNQITGNGQMGTGVMVQAVQRVRDSFIDDQIRAGTSNQGEVAIEMDALQQVENAFMEPSQNPGVSDALTSFYNSWQTLTQNPEDVASRQEVVSTAQNLVTVVNSIDQDLRKIRTNMDTQLRKDVTQVNDLLQQIATVNKEIGKVVSVGNTPNDLLDSRDTLVDQLSKYLDINVSATDNDMIAIHIGSRQLLWNDSVYQLTDNPEFDHPSQNSQTPYYVDVSQSDFNSLSGFATGELKGLLNSRDVLVPEAQTSFTDAITSFMDEINNANSAGYGQTAFVQDLGVSTTTDVLVQGSPYAYNLPALPAGQIDPSPASDNVVRLTAVKNINVGDMIRIEEPDSVAKTFPLGGSDPGRDGITVKVTAIKGNDIYFQKPFDPLYKSAAAGDPNAVFQVKAGAEVYKIESPKNNFFDINTMLPENFIGDTNPVYQSRMTSTINLDNRINLNTTIADLENIFGVDITGINNGLTLKVDNNAETVGVTQGMTLGTFIQRVNDIRPMSTDGEPLDLSFDAINHRLILKANGLGGLDQLGGKTGSDLNMFRIFGFEGYNMTGFQQTVGTTVDATKLSSIGVSDGWFMVDGVTLKADSTISIKDNMTAWNNALAAGTTSQKTQFFFDPVERRIKIISDHQFSVRDAVAPFPSAPNPPYTKSNFLTQMGFRDAEGDIDFSVKQQVASVTTSDVCARIKVNDQLVEDVNKIATSRNAAGTPGDNSVAIAIANSQNMKILNNTGTEVKQNPTQTVDDFYNSMISDIGTKAQKANTDNTVVQNFLDYYNQKKQEVSGVSIDEEMTKMIQAQQSFAAASRMITTIDDMLSTIITGMGLVGR